MMLTILSSSSYVNDLGKTCIVNEIQEERMWARHKRSLSFHEVEFGDGSTLCFSNKTEVGQFLVNNGYFSEDRL